MGLFGNDATVTTTFAGRDKMTPVVRGIKSTMANFKLDAATGFGLAAGINVMGLATRAIGKVTDYLGDALHAAQEEEASIAKLTTAIEANVEGWDGNTDAMESVLKTRMKLGFSDDEQRDSLAKLVGVTHDVTTALDVQR